MMNRKYHRDYSRKYYHKKMMEMFKSFGGKCKKCGSGRSLQFDHIDPRKKKFNISDFLSFSKHETLNELKKCQVLCKRCHLKKTSKDMVILKSKLSPRQVREIRMKHSRGISRSELAKQYFVTYPTIRDIVLKITWADY